MKYSISFFC